MNKTIAILSGLVLVLAAGVLAFLVLSARPGVSMSLVKYQRWPHGAMLRLTNGTQTTIRYLAEPNDTPAGNPVLCLQKTSGGWTNTSLTVKSAIAFDPRIGKTTEVFLFIDPAALPKPGDRMEVVLSRDLKPGQSVEFFVRLEPDAFPKRVGTVCCF